MRTNTRVHTRLHVHTQIKLPQYRLHAASLLVEEIRFFLSMSTQEVHSDLNSKPPLLVSKLATFSNTCGAK